MESTEATDREVLMGSLTEKSGSRDHWNRIYSTKASKELSWYEDEPRLSLDLIGRYVAPHSSIVDVGGGLSMLVPLLAAKGFGPCTVVDLSDAALKQVRERLGVSGGDLITFRVGNILRAVDLGHFDAWHDRAVFHFLTDAKDRERYVELAAQTVRPGGHLILGTFALSGPDRCSGLPICRYDSVGIAQLFAKSFRVLDYVDHLHKTPSGVDQKFLFTVLSRNAGALQDGQSGFPRTSEVILQGLMAISPFFQPFYLDQF